MTTNIRPGVSSADRSLRNLDGLDDTTRGRVLKKLHADGLLTDDSDGRLFAAAATSPAPQLHRLPSPIEAAAARPQSAQRIHMVMAQARRLGAVLDETKPIDLHALDRQIAGKGSSDDRFALKSELHLLGLIPA